MTEYTPLLSVVLACYNEAEHLHASFDQIRDTLEGATWPFEIIFVDDASRDGTPLLLDRIVTDNPHLEIRLIKHTVNRGRGASVTDGFRAARGAVTGYLDVDLETHCRYIPSLVNAIQKGADIATVRRIYAFQLRSLDRYFMSRGYSLLVRQLLHVPFHDTESGFKFFRSSSLRPLLDEIQDTGWFWDTELMALAARHHLIVKEIPGAYLRRADKTSTVRGLRDSLEYFVRLLAARRRLRAQRD